MRRMHAHSSPLACWLGDLPGAAWITQHPCVRAKEQGAEREQRDTSSVSTMTPSQSNKRANLGSCAQTYQRDAQTGHEHSVPPTLVLLSRSRLSSVNKIPLWWNWGWPF